MNREEIKVNPRIIPLLNESTDFEDTESRLSMASKVMEDETKKFKENYFESAGLFSVIFFKWVYPLIKFSQKNRITNSDLGQPYSKCRAEIQKELIYKHWQTYCHKSEHALLKALLKSYKCDFMTVIVYNFVRCVVIIAQPIMTTMILEYIQNPGESDKSFYYVLLLVIGYNILDVVSNLLMEQSDFIQMLLGVKAIHGIVGIIYDKILKLSSATNKIFSQGEIINFIDVDVEKISKLVTILPLAVRFPFQVVFGLCFLFYYFGYSLFAGVGFGIFFIICNYLIGKAREVLQKKVLREKDRRMRATTEAINNIKVIKLNSWKNLFVSQIFRTRNKELIYIRLCLLIDFISVFLGWLLSPGLLLLTLLLFYLTGNYITLPKAYAAMQVFKMLELPMRWVPQFTSAFIEFSVSMKRIHTFLICKEINLQAVCFRDASLDDNVGVQICNSNFSWGGLKQVKPNVNKANSKLINIKQNNEDSQTVGLTVRKSILLKSLNLTIYSGEFICIIGEVGSGKSSLISCILGDMIAIDEDTINEIGDKLMDKETHNILCDRSMILNNVVRLGGSMCLVQQNPWIQNKTIRDNILFGSSLHENRYNKAIEACQLAADLEILKGGDLTEIGEKGINLSGGQKARVSLARAVYSDCDIVLMDDPVSALDSNVKHKVFEDVFCGELKHKTRILVTHAVDLLHLADRIVIMDKGTVKHIGTYKELEHSDEIRRVIGMIAKIYIDEHKTDDDTDNIVDEHKDDNEPVSIAPERSKSFISTEEIKITVDESKELIDVKWNVYYHLFIKDSNWITYLLVGPLFFVYSYFGVYSTYYSGVWIEHSEDKSKFWINFIYAVSHSFGFAISMVCVTVLVCYSTVRKSRILHEAMLNKIVNAPINTYFDKTPSGMILNRFSRDLNKIDGEIFKYIMWISESFVAAMFIFYVAVMNSVWVLTVIPVIVLICYFLMKLYMKACRELARLQSINGTPLISHLGETLNGLSTIRAFEKQNDFVIKNTEYLNIRMNASFWKESSKRWFSVRVSLASSLIFLFTSIFCVCMKDSTNALLFGMMFTQFLIFNRQIVNSTMFLTELESSMVSYDRCLKITNVPQEDQRPYDPHMTDWPQNPSIEFKDFSLRYRPDTELVLNHLSFKIDAKQKIGVVGRTGAGKSTICLALCRIVEAAAGQILIGDVDISKISLENLRASIAIIPQDPTLFEDTLRYNLDPEGTVSDQQLLDLLNQASLDALIARDDKGLSQHIDEKGQNLSSGEKQLICICRAILRNSKIVLMDEATANIDIKTEQTIQQLIHEKFVNATVITIAHRLNTVIKSDKVLVLDKGTVAEFDSPQILMNDKSSMFYSFLKKLKRS